MPPPDLPPPIPNQYTPEDWYWVVAGSATQVFSSATGNYVSNTAPAFLTWKLGPPVRLPTPIASEDDLGIVLAQDVIRPQAAGVLEGYTGRQADTVVAGIIFKVLFNHENRIRALNGQPPITAQQARNAIKAML